MEERLFPNWQELSEQHNPLTLGELALIRYLDENLPKDINWKAEQGLYNYDGWLIFAQPFLNGTRPDVIIFNPFVGIVIYEVKDWRLANYEFRSNQELYVSDGKGSYPIKSPVHQVEYYKEKIIGQLIPKIGEEIDNNTKSFGLIKTALYFHNSTTDYVQHFFKARVGDYKYFPVFGNDSLKSNEIQKIVPDVNRRRSNFWVKDWNEDIIFWLKPPFHSIEQGKPLRLKAGQVQISTPQSGHFRVKGVAGSGKTQALAYRAASLASKGFNVLIISFNITLWHYVKDMVARAPFAFDWKKITFNHFHGFCSDTLNYCGVKWPKPPDRDSFVSKNDYDEALDGFFKSVIPNAVIESIADSKVHKYDAVLIDEGQDYQIEWYELLTEHFLGDRDEVLIVCDKRQNIYERELDWLDKRGSNKVSLSKFKADFTRLTETYRLPPKVVKLSNDFSDIFGLDQELKVSKILQNTELFVSEHIVWMNIKEEEWEYYLWSSFLRLKKEGQSASDMVFLLPNHDFGEKAVKKFKENNIEINHIFSESGKSSKFHKKSFWMGDSRIKMSTIHSFKGWELINVVLLVPASTTDFQQMDAIVYTAITRTRQNIVVLNCSERYVDFGDKLPKKWNEQ